MSISSDASMAQSTDKEDISDSSWQQPNTQTANIGEQATEDASGSDGADVKSNTSEKEPEESNMGNSAIEEHDDRAGSADGEAKEPVVSARAHRTCSIADDIVSAMEDVNGAMMELYEYVKARNQEKKPLYQWSTFDGYRDIKRALADLERAAAKLEETHLPAAVAKSFLNSATQISLAVSQIAVFAMGVMSEKISICVDEIEESTLSAEGKVQAQAMITEELRRLLKHCAKATDRVYTALDSLRNSLHTNEFHQSPDVSIIKDLILESEARLSTPRRSWLWDVAKVVLGAVTSATIAIVAAHLYITSGLDLALQANPDSMHSKVISLVQRAQAVTNLTGEIYSTKLEDLGQRYKELEGASESHGLRIDNLVEALGIPNEDGTYYSSMPKTNNQVSSDVPNISADAERQIARLRSELESMRKNVHRMDIRLMKRLDKIDRHGS